jgi:ABC-type Fe3+/spermidine/putrescine transport system ATPase subunit
MRGWCSAQGIPKHVTGQKLDAVYNYFNWMYEGFLGALIMRQGYYIANGKNLPAWLKSGRASSRLGRRSRPPSTTSGTTARLPRPTSPGITGRVGDIKKGQVRDGGPFSKRSCKYTSWNSFFHAERVPGEEVQRLPQRLARWQGGRGLDGGGGTAAPSQSRGQGSTRSADEGLPRRHRRRRRRQPARRPRRVRRPARPVGLRQDDDAAHDRRARVPDEGDIVLDGQSLVDLAPHKRPTTTVFQHFALFPHRTCSRTSSSGSRCTAWRRTSAARQAIDALEMVGLDELADRKPRALSGGQQQRVALARVLVTKPKALLLDEPLGDLDRLLQLRMRVELRNLQRQLGLMFIHVTHNQEEALSMADRIVVMNDARIQQIADPLTIATRPETELVARFMGDNNIIRGRVVERVGDRIVVADEHDVRASVVAPGDDRAVGDEALVSCGRRPSKSRTTPPRHPRTRPSARSSSSSSSATSSSSTSRRRRAHAREGAGRALPDFRGREGETIRITWKEEDVQLLRA